MLVPCIESGGRVSFREKEKLDIAGIGQVQHLVSGATGINNYRKT